MFCWYQVLDQLKFSREADYIYPERNDFQELAQEIVMVSLASLKSVGRARWAGSFDATDLRQNYLLHETQFLLLSL